MAQDYISLAVTMLALYAAFKYKDELVALLNDAIGGLNVAPAGGGGAPLTTGGTGDAPYAGSNPQQLEDQGEGTRHYASGKADDVTHEWEGTTSAQSYMVVIDITLTEIDHDDTITIKFGGTHNGSGWYEMRWTFESGQSQIGAEESHPNSSDCSEGTAIGTIVNQQAMLAVANFNKGERLEQWHKRPGGAWEKAGESANGVCGFRPSESEDEIQVRIDGAPGIDMHSAQFYELGGSPGTPAPTGGEITNEPETDSDEEGGAEDESNSG